MVLEPVAIARLIRTRGNKGELAAIALSTHPERAKHVLVNQAQLEVERVWLHGDRLIFKFVGIDSISAAEPLAGFEVFIPAEERAALAEGEFYLADLVGCHVIERKTGQTIGVVSDWQEHGGPPLLEVKRNDGRELLVPYAQSICVAIDPVLRRIEVDLPEGLMEL